MLETRLSELFFRQGPCADGALPEAEVARLNCALARRYQSVDDRGDALDAPPEPLPLGSLRYPAFRRHLHRALEHLAADVQAKEQAVQRVIRDLHGDAAAQEAIAEPRELLFCRPAWNAGDMADIETSDLEEAPKEHTCWAPTLTAFTTLPLSPTALTTRLRDLLANLEEHEHGQETVKLLQTVTSLVLRSSKQALDLAMDYRGTAKSLAERLQTEPREWLRDMAPGCEDECGGLKARHGHEASTPPRPRRWRYDAGDGLHADPRAAPAVAASRTGHHVFPGEEFEVVHEFLGEDGVLYLELADGRGWLFEAKPGVGKMCTLAPDTILGVARAQTAVITSL